MYSVSQKQRGVRLSSQDHFAASQLCLFAVITVCHSVHLSHKHTVPLSPCWPVLSLFRRPPIVKPDMAPTTVVVNVFVENFLQMYFLILLY